MAFKNDVADDTATVWPPSGTPYGPPSGPPLGIPSGPPLSIPSGPRWASRLAAVGSEKN
jgi:hypothetical protein